MPHGPVKCPKCKCDTIQTQPEPNLTFDRCEKCKGTWLDRGELSQFNSLDKDLPESGSLISFERETDMTCPRCDQRGEKHSLFQIPYSFEENVSQAELYVDYCKSCHGIWLDEKELGSVQTVLKKMRIQKKLRKIGS
jgi:Zn-finger nucleic acid-binding protein